MSNQNEKPTIYLSTLIGILVTLGLLGFTWWSTSQDMASDGIRFIGRFHPTLLHLPIGFLVILLILEMATGFSRKQDLRSACGIVALATALSAVLAASLGLILALPGDYVGETFARHRLLGIATAVFTVWLYVLHRWSVASQSRLKLNLYRLGLGITVVVITVTGHYGGALTHGSGYLTRYMPAPLMHLFGIQPEPVFEREPVLFQDADVFAHVIQPLLGQYCIECHSEEKQKGDLRLDSYDFIMAGGDYGESLVPHDGDSSELIRRMRLSPDDADRMPPEDKAQPTDDEVALLHWWIQKGAPRTGALAQMNIPTTTLKRIHTFLGHEPVDFQNAIAPLSTLTSELEVLSGNERIEISPTANGADTLIVKASRTYRGFNDEDLASLLPIANNIIQLRIGYSDVTDEGIQYLQQMPHLQRLELQRTSITDTGVEALRNHAKLKYLNLYGTRVSNGIFSILSTMPSLKAVYLWETDVSAPAAERYREGTIDNFQLQSWKAQIQELESRIADLGVTVDTGPDYEPLSLLPLVTPEANTSEDSLGKTGLENDQ